MGWMGVSKKFIGYQITNGGLGIEQFEYRDLSVLSNKNGC
jgi:hypothetical protein